jgi:hypothetical protein
MSHKTRKIFLWAGGVTLFASPLLLTLAYYVVFWDIGWDDLPHLFSSTSADVGYHPATAWQADRSADRERIREASLCTRTIAPDNPVLLLTRAVVESSYDRAAGEWRVVSRTRVAAVYRYDPAADRLEAVADETWDQASGPIGECQSRSETTNRVYLNKGRGVLHLNWHPVEFAGRYLIKVAVSPSLARVAVLSSGGIRAPNFMPFSGSSAIRGQRYHQVYSLQADKFMGEPVRLPSGERELGWSEPSMCWTADERYVIYSVFAQNLVVAPGRP